MLMHSKADMEACNFFFASVCLYTKTDIDHVIVFC